MEIDRLEPLQRYIATAEQSAAAGKEAAAEQAKVSAGVAIASEKPSFFTPSEDDVKRVERAIIDRLVKDRVEAGRPGLVQWSHYVVLYFGRVEKGRRKIICTRARLG